MKRNSVSGSGLRKIAAIIKRGKRFTERKFVAADRAKLREQLQGGLSSE